MVYFHTYTVISKSLFNETLYGVKTDISGSKNVKRVVVESGITLDAIQSGSINIDGDTTCSMYAKGSKIVVETRQTLVECSDGEME